MMGEEVNLVEKISITRSIEEWLSDLDRGMVGTLKNLVVRCKNGANFSDFPGQILCLGEAVRFTREVEDILGSAGSIKDIHQRLMGRLTELTKMRKDGDDLSGAKVEGMIMDTIHNASVVEELVEKRVVNKEDWGWYKQLRFYSTHVGDVHVKMLACRQEYSFEYQGNSSKLVHTPLTDKCYMTLMHGLHLGYGGNPYGPAGTGKTESVKALGSWLGRQVLVFNCDEGIDYKSMTRIFVGLVRCGAWGCFDEFNRLLEEQMSAISQQIE
ncbi:Cytoplasmic dynein 2 heavy chain 1, partial [Perkinsus olseni]